MSATRDFVYCALSLSISVFFVYYVQFSPFGKSLSNHLFPFLTRSTQNFSYPDHPSLIIRRHCIGVDYTRHRLSGWISSTLLLPQSTITVDQPHDQPCCCRHYSLYRVYAVPEMVFINNVSRSLGYWLTLRTSIWASLYQSLTGAIVVPLYLITHLCLLQNSSSSRIPRQQSHYSFRFSSDIYYLLP